MLSVSILSLSLSVSQAPRSPHGPAAPAAAAAHKLAGRHGGAHQEDGFSATGSWPGGRQAPSGGAQGGLAYARLMGSYANLQLKLAPVLSTHILMRSLLGPTLTNAIVVVTILGKVSTVSNYVCMTSCINVFFYTDFFFVIFCCHFLLLNKKCLCIYSIRSSFRRTWSWNRCGWTRWPTWWWWWMRTAETAPPLPWRANFRWDFNSKDAHFTGHHLFFFIYIFFPPTELFLRSDVLDGGWLQLAGETDWAADNFAFGHCAHN